MSPIRSPGIANEPPIPIGTDANPRPAPPLALEIAGLVLELSVALALLGIGVAVLGSWLRDPLSTFATRLVIALGPAGIGVGTFLADGLHFPIPVQFYMVAVVAHGGPLAVPFAAMTIGSLAGGHLAFFVSQKIVGIRLVARGTRRASSRMKRLLDRFGTRAIIVGALLPVPYSFLCYLAGMNRLPYRQFAWVLALRPVKLLLFFALVRAGWGT